MSKNNFNIPNYIHLSYQGFLDDKMNKRKNIQLKTALKNASKIIHKSFQNATGLSVEEYLKNASNEIESMQAMIALFSGDGLGEEDPKAIPFSEIWKKYSNQVESKINSLGLSSEEKSYLLDYTKASAKVTNISLALRMLTQADKLEQVQNYLTSFTQDFDEELLNEFNKSAKKNGNTWAKLLINQALKETLTMTKSLDSLNNVEKTYTFGQTMGSTYDTLVKEVNNLNSMYARGANANTIRNKVNYIRGIINKNVKGTGTETVSLVNIPSIRQKSQDIIADLVHTGLKGEVKKYENTIEFTRIGGGKSSTLLTTSAEREVKLADVTIKLQNDNKIKDIKVSRKMYDIKAKHINLGTLSVAQANAMISTGQLSKYAFLNNQYAYTFYSAMNFFLMRKNMWYRTDKNIVRLVQDNARKKRTMGKFGSLRETQETLRTEIISSFLGATYASFFISDFAAFYDIGNFVVPSPLMFDYSIERINREDLKTGITNFVSIGVDKKAYEEAIRNNGSGERGIYKNNKKYYPFQLMALKRNKAAIQKINNCQLNLKSYNITNKEYYYDMFNKIKY